MEHVGTLIIGAGVAGIALAYHLGRGGEPARAPVVVLERAPRVGAHASGRSARLVLQSVHSPTVRALGAASVRAYRQRAAAVGFDRCGSLLLGPRASLAATRADEVKSEEISADAARQRVPLLARHAFTAALWTPSDGVLDSQRLLAFYLEGARRAGVRVELGRAVTAIVGDGPFEVATSGSPLRAERVVDAAGAWALELASCARASTPPLVAYKRHLFELELQLPPGQPFVWDLAHDVYFRAAEGGTLACMCDETATRELAETVDPAAEERLRLRLRPISEVLAEAPLARAWSCFRTKTPDGLPLLGPDPRRHRFWWVAGLAGHGLGSSWEIGRLGARALIEGAQTLPAAMLPARFG